MKTPPTWPEYFSLIRSDNASILLSGCSKQNSSIWTKTRFVPSGTPKRSDGSNICQTVAVMYGLTFSSNEIWIGKSGLYNSGRPVNLLSRSRLCFSALWTNDKILRFYWWHSNPRQRILNIHVLATFLSFRRIHRNEWIVENFRRQIKPIGRQCSVYKCFKNRVFVQFCDGFIVAIIIGGGCFLPLWHAIRRVQLLYWMTFRSTRLFLQNNRWLKPRQRYKSLSWS